MRIIIFILLFTFGALTSAKGQFDNYVKLSADLGIVANSERDKNIGAGGTISWLTTDVLFSRSNHNYISVSIKAFNNPYEEGKFISSILNGLDDGFNYIRPLLGYRFSQNGFDEGFFIEPRVGAAFGSSYTALAFSPLAGYTYQNFDFSIFCDLGLGSKNNAVLKKNFFTPGLTVAYSFGL